MKQAKMKGICLFMLTCSVTPDNSAQAIHGAVIPYLMVKALAGASALPQWGSGPSLRNDCAVEELQSQGLESEQSLLVK